ncbi:hypothetical protein P7K49_029891 [Saguinus oedipus]|uniref:Uncharacterized protein n=1 Tax=Saguinus oedipus TaxID=9490 RepID=A0ABQ9U8I2_SAGOE|nr:hypothetical protein P7K49_029891 [Saguinus oedipus]
MKELPDVQTVTVSELRLQQHEPKATQWKSLCTEHGQRQDHAENSEGESVWKPSIFLDQQMNPQENGKLGPSPAWKEYTQVAHFHSARRRTQIRAH